MPIRERISGPPLTRAVAAEATVVDKDKRIVRLSFSSEDALVERYSWWDDPWLERLGHDEGEVDLSFLNEGGAPVLWGHDRWSRSSMVGVIEKAWVENGRGYADVRLSARADVEGLQLDITDGIVRNVSVGYQILERTLVKQNKDKPSEYRVTSWKPLEISFVPIPADEGVGVGRSDDAAPQQRYTVTTIEERNMPNNVQNTPAAPANTQRQDGSAVNTNDGGQPGEGQRAAPTPPPTPAPAPATAVQSTETEGQRAVRLERERCEQIDDIATRFNLGDAFVRNARSKGHTVEQVRADALTALEARTPPTNPRMVTGVDERDKQREGIAIWLLHRGAVISNPEGMKGNQYRGMSLLDVARHCLEQQGINTRGMLNTEIAKRAIASSTSDFPIALENTLHKLLDAKFNLASLVWRRFCRKGTLSDFRPHNRYASGSFGDLDIVGEDNLFTYGDIPDAEKNSITARTRGKLVTLSRQMIVNDDLGYFLSLGTDIAQASARTVENRVFAVLASNPTLADGGALFNATVTTTAGGHANLNASGAAPSMAGFDAVRVAMGRQTAPGGKDYVGFTPSIWLGPLELGGAARKVNKSENDPDVSGKNAQPNIVQGNFRDIIDTPRLSGNVWYAFADPNEAAVMEVGFLNGQETPYTEMKEGFEQDGIVWKVRLDFEAGAVGWRGGQKVTW
jgi:hypothetical protein